VKIGMRKFAAMVLVELLLWVLAVWAPAVTEPVRLAAINAMWLVVGLYIGGNVGEHWAVRKAPQ
jgi:hypothetical protein